jgi:Ni,Fe-hydrogenase maturation factor
MLVPELAPLLAGTATVVFVDARAGVEPGRVRIEPVEESGEVAALGHLLDAGALLGLARSLYASPAEAFHVSIDGACFDLGAALSPSVASALPLAADAVLEVTRTGGTIVRRSPR